MKGALIILLVTVVVGIILYLFDRRHRRSEISEDKEERDDASASKEESVVAESEAGECCGLHLVCEKELTALTENRIVYYDDEELDRFIGRGRDDYNGEEVEEFRDILMTLLPQDVAGWARSLDRRGIEPPQEVRDELLIMLRELTQ